MVIPALFQNLFQSFTRLWAYVRTWCHNHHLSFILLLVWTILRFNIFVVGVLITQIIKMGMQTQTLVNGLPTNSASVLTYFGVVNAFFPVPELFVMLSAIYGLRGLLMYYSSLRTFYKNIPLKST